MRTITSILDGFPPRLIRFLARTGRGYGSRRLTHQDVADASGLPYVKVVRISKMSDWSNVTIAEADAFMRGCGIDLSSLPRQRFYLKRSLDPRITSEPTRFAVRKSRGVLMRPPSAEMLVRAATS